MLKDVFISHSSVDGDKAHAVCGVLEQEGISCWIAPRDLHGGLIWGDLIPTALRECRAVVLILSSSADRSDQVRNEVAMAFKNGRIVIPFWVEQFTLSNELALSLSRIHWLEAFDGPFESHLLRLVANVRGVLSSDGAGGDRVQARPFAPPPPVTPSGTASGGFEHRSRPTTPPGVSTLTTAPVRSPARWIAAMAVTVGALSIIGARLLRDVPANAVKEVTADSQPSSSRCSPVRSAQILLAINSQFSICQGEYFLALDRQRANALADDECQLRLVRASNGATIKQTKILSTVSGDRPRSWSQSVKELGRELNVELVEVQDDACVVKVAVR